MREYKPEYLGKVIQPDDSKKMKDFVENKYDSFSKIYDTCKKESENITGLQCLSTEEGPELKVRIIADTATLENIKKKTEEAKNVIMERDTIIAS